MPSRTAQRRTRSTSVVKPDEIIQNGHVLENVRVDIDIDALLAEAGLTPRYSKDYFVMSVFGEKFRVRKQVNLLAFILIDEDDPKETADSIKGILDMIHDEDKGRFKTAIASNAALDGKAVNLLVQQMIQGATDPNPTNSSRASGRTRKASTSKALSAAD